MNILGDAAPRAARNLVVTSIAVAVAFGLAGCSPSNEPAAEPASSSTGSTAPSVAPSTEAPAPAAPAAPLSLEGGWRQVNSDDPERWQTATITTDTITVDWVSEGGDTRALYWAGSFAAPTDASESYSWSSSNDTSQTESALLASSAPTKEFAYDGGLLSYEVTVMGVTAKIELARE